MPILRPTLRRTVLWLLVVLTAGASAVAAGGLDERIDIELKDAAGPQVLRSFGQILKAKEVVIDPALTRDVTITLHNARVKTVMDALCDSLGCRWSLEDGTLTFVPDPDYRPPEEGGAEAANPLDRPIDMDLEDAPIRDVLQMFGRIADVKVEIAPEVQGTMTVHLHHEPARSALEQVCKQHEIVCELNVSDGEESVLRVTPRTKK